MNISGSNAESGYADISIIAIGRIALRRKIVFLGVFLVSVSISIAVAFLATPIYSSAVLLSPTSAAAIPGAVSQFLLDFGSSSPLTQLGQSASDSRDVSIAALSSAYFTRAFIEEQNLMPLLFEEKWDAESGKWNVRHPSELPTLADAYELFSTKVARVSENPQTGLVTLTVIWKDPELAAAWANALVADVNKRLQARAIEESERTLEFLSQELAGTNAVELQQSIYRSIESEIQKRTAANVRNEYAFSVLSPAIAADTDKPDSPNRPFVISVGILLGLLLGLSAAILVDRIGYIRQADNDGI